ncbi:FKBP-type peptidyl-prolyl cis-trans isomerase [Microbacterium sp. NPDC057650]|uniref:FKBP-type peptidyl-prolyl cis-trans isomerase n=1 Tax=unclassified Microbacterium TaxID=2609290 RepID=UPI00366CB967
MRLRRPLALLSTVAVATLILAGCAGSPDAASTPTPTKSSSKCVLDTQPGATSDSIKIDGSGLDAKVTVPKDAKFADVERTVVKKGDGKDITPTDFISVRYQLVQADTGAVLDTSKRGPEGVLPVLLNPNAPQQLYDMTMSPIFLIATECMPIGSEAVLALPGEKLGENQPSVVLYVQTLEKLPTVATGKKVDPPAGMATVKLDKDGAPTITIPKTDPPTETKIGQLKQGDGATVTANDLVTVQYRGVKWSDGKEFDSTWSRDAYPSQFPATGVVKGFQQALIGQKVGSQVLAEIPPKDGYGASKGHELEKETLVFVVDIIGTTPIEKQ